MSVAINHGSSCIEEAWGWHLNLKLVNNWLKL